MDELTYTVRKDGGHQLLESRGCIAITHLHVLARGTFGWAHLWSTLLASFLNEGGSAILDNVVLCGNIINCILQQVEGHFSGWYHLITYLDDSWISEVQDYPHFSLKWGS